LYWGYNGTFTEVRTIYHSWINPLHHSPLSPFSHSWNSFNRSYFSIYIHVYIIFPPYLSSYILFLYPSPPTSTNLPDKTCFAFLFCFCKKKKKIIIITFMFKIDTGCSLWHFHVCIYYNLNWFTPSIFLLSTLVPFLRWFQQT
jgi:hypothetical protein